jgi:hypothetical protein
VLNSPGRQLDPAARAFMEPRFGHDLGDVRVHTDGAAGDSAHALAARAYAAGNHLVFAPGEYAPDTHTGRALLAHELAHVLQSEEQGDRKLRRTIGDTNDLSSPRFAGDEVLEAVFDGERLLRLGDSGDAVFKIQQALIDAGFDLPTFGANGEFDSETRDAVIAFQTASGLAFSQIDGIVGPITMSRLDSRFPTEDAAGPSPDCEEGVATVVVDVVMMRGASGDPLGDIDFANGVFSQCCVQFSLGTGVTVEPDLSDSFLGGGTDLPTAGCGAATPEELAMVLGSTEQFGLTGRIKVFYVASMTPSLQGLSTAPLCATGPRAPLRDVVYVMNGHSQRALAHEFAHILMNTFGEHSVRPDNLQHIDAGATGDERLEPVQCGIIFARA